MATPAEGPAAATAKKHQDEETQGLEKVTDYVEETEITAELSQAMSNIESDLSKKKEARAKREQELSKVTINKELVVLIMKEMDMSKTASERVLREHKGDVISALLALTDE